MYLCNSSAPLGRPTAYWYLLVVLAMMGVMCLAIAVATILRGIVPHAMGLILPLGFISGIILAAVIAFMIASLTLLIARCVSVSVRACRAAGHLDTIA